MANEAQASQAHRAELDFDINGLKEKIETLDQGGWDSQFRVRIRSNVLRKYLCRASWNFQNVPRFAYKANKTLENCANIGA